jgi:glycosyltransferase involved in cell wall biosynthesis
MPSKNVKTSFFKEALNSVYSQSTFLWNLIIIVDNFDEEFLRNFDSVDDRRVSLLKNESQLINGALNTGMKYATTPYVCSLHCDDLLDKAAIEVMCRYIRKYPDIDFFHSSRLYIDENGCPISSVYRARESFALSDFKDYGPVKHLHCWKVSSALAIGGMDESLGLHGGDDYDFPWCMAEAGYSFKAVVECLYYKRDHRAYYRLSTHVPLERQIEELKKIWRKHRMTEREIECQISRRRGSYLKEALYVDEQDRIRKEKEGFDIHRGWRAKHQ